MDMGAECDDANTVSNNSTESSVDVHKYPSASIMLDISKD